MKKLKQLFILLLTVMLVFLSACGKSSPEKQNPDSPDSSVTAKNVRIQLLYCSKDTLNPFNTKNKSNYELSGLMYESIVSVSDNFESNYLLAKQITNDGNSCTVQLKDILFSDNTPLTSDDVIYSYGLARSSDLFSYLFYEVKSVSAPDNKTIKFELSKNDPFFMNLLTFPIIKKDSDKLKNEDNVELAPIGCGKFYFSVSDTALLANPYYHGQRITDKITLVDAPDLESVQHYVEIGATDCYFTDPADSNIVRMSGNKASLNMNNLVYIGINHSDALFSNSLIRQAISSAIDRAAIAKESYYGYAEAANGFFHPEWQEISGYQTLQSTQDIKICVENLEKIGYNNLDRNGFRVNSNGAPISLSLLVNKSNNERLAAANLICEQLKEVGIKMTVNSVSDEQYFSMLSSGNFQLYLGEARLTANMDISSLVLEGGSAAYGVKNSLQVKNDEGETETVSSPCAEVMKNYYSGTSSISEVATSLLNDMPIIPVVYRSSLLFYSNNISGLNETLRNDFFYSLRFRRIF